MRRSSLVCQIVKVSVLNEYDSHNEEFLDSDESEEESEAGAEAISSSEDDSSEEIRDAETDSPGLVRQYATSGDPKKLSQKVY